MLLDENMENRVVDLAGAMYSKNPLYREYSDEAESLLNQIKEILPEEGQKMLDRLEIIYGCKQGEVEQELYLHGYIDGLKAR